MMIEIMTMLVVPVLYCSVQEWKTPAGNRRPTISRSMLRYFGWSRQIEAVNRTSP